MLTSEIDRVVIDIESQLPDDGCHLEISQNYSIPSSVSPTKTESLALTMNDVVDPFKCYICYETIIPSDQSIGHSFKLSCGHAFCTPCLQNFVSSCITDGNTAPKCFYPLLETINNPEDSTIPPHRKPETKCDVPLSDEEVDTLIADCNLRLKYNRFKFMSANANNGRECPFEGCGELQLGDPNHPEMVCRK